jgi:hypothetical protein
MPATLHPDFRSGNLSEDLGILLLRIFSAVAPTPRPDDVGIDAVATLLRKESEDCLVAEDSFYVQLKSHSERKVEYKGNAVRWLTNLRLPLFIGRVDKQTASMELYSTHRLSQQLVGQAPKEIELKFGRTAHRGALLSCDISPPVLHWSTEAFSDERFAEKAYSLLHPIIRAEQLNIGFRVIGYCREVRWTTNGVAETVDNITVAHGPMEIPEEIAQLLPPHLCALAIHAAAKGNIHSVELIMQLIESKRQAGLNLDPKNLVGLVAFAGWQPTRRRGGSNAPDTR